MHERHDPAANVFRRIFRGIGEGQWRLGAKPDAGDEAQRGEPDIVRRERAGDGGNAEQQKIELINRLAAETVGARPDRTSRPRCYEQRGADHGAELRGGCEIAAHHVGTSDPNTATSTRSRKKPAVMSAMTRICSGLSLASPVPLQRRIERIRGSNGLLAAMAFPLPFDTRRCGQALPTRAILFLCRQRIVVGTC